MTQTAAPSAAPRRIAILSSAAGGGGGIAARRLAEALNATPGVVADFLSVEDFGGSLPETVAPRRNMSNHRLTDTHYTVEYPGFRRDWVVDLLAGYDVVNIHWASYLISLAEIEALAARGTRVVFMLHDFHYITGGCHYPAGCTRMTAGCLHCPQIDPALADPSVMPANLRLKRAVFARPNVRLLAPSRYLRDEAVATGIVSEDRAHVLRNPYAPIAPAQDWPDDGAIRIALVADSLTERRKGVRLALDSLKRLQAHLARNDPDRYAIVHIIGQADPALTEALKTLRLPHRAHGRIRDHARLAGILALCDILLTCSTEDNWPNVLVEAGSYGVAPVVGPGHGCEEFARLYDTGAVAAAYTPEAFGRALADLIARLPDAAARAAAAARIRADHDPAALAAAFLRLAA